MQVKIFSFADNIPALEKAVNEWLKTAGSQIEIIAQSEKPVYDDFTKKVVVTITIWYKNRVL